MTYSSNRGGFGSSDWLVGAVKNNPEGLLLMAAGCALLMRSGTSWAGRRMGQHMRHQSSSERQQAYMGGDRQSDWGMRENINRSVENARDYASDLTRSVSETAGEYASSVGDYADRAKRTIVESSGRFAEQAQSTLQNTVENVVREQPLAVALAGLAAGALVAAAFPPTSIERKTLGSAGERLSEMASRTGEHLQEAASKAGERLMSTAEERGLSAEGLKQMATEAAGAFGSAFSGEKQDKSSSGMSGSGGGSDSRSDAGSRSDMGTRSDMGSRGSQSSQAGMGSRSNQTSGAGSQSSQGGAGSQSGQTATGSQSSQSGSRTTSGSRTPSSSQSGGTGGGSGRGPGVS